MPCINSLQEWSANKANNASLLFACAFNRLEGLVQPFHSAGGDEGRISKGNPIVHRISSEVSNSVHPCSVPTHRVRWWSCFKPRQVSTVLAVIHKHGLYVFVEVHILYFQVCVRVRACGRKTTHTCLFCASCCSSSSFLCGGEGEEGGGIRHQTIRRQQDTLQQTLELQHHGQRWHDSFISYGEEEPITLVLPYRRSSKKLGHRSYSTINSNHHLTKMLYRGNSQKHFIRLFTFPLFCSMCSYEFRDLISQTTST